MRQAVDDGAVLPLLYEGRMVDLDANEAQLDKWFERRTRDLNDDQRSDLKRKMSRAAEIYNADQRMQEVAYDLARHYVLNFQGTGAKAQLATGSKEAAIKYHYLLEDEGLVRSGVSISPPDTREGHTEVGKASLPLVQEFWQSTMDRYGDEDAYNRELLRSFNDPEGIEVLIVVDKLLVGFDEPRNTVLYIDKPLKEHGILQAIARVNRLFEGKDYGYVIDYRGVLGELNEALQVYNALEDYDVEDVAGTITDVSAVISQLPQHHSDLWAVFNAVQNRNDPETMERFLEPEDQRQKFYDALRAYARSMKVSLSATPFYDQVPEDRIRTYKRDLQFFHNLRMAVKMRYSEVIDYREYEQKIRKLLDDHITARDTKPITELVDIFDAEAFNAEVEQVEGAAAKADTIAHRLKRTISERMEQDPAFYRKFSELVEETISLFQLGRIDEAEYLERMSDAMEEVRSGHDRSQPAKLQPYRDAPAYFGVMQSILSQTDEGEPQVQDDVVADMAIEIEAIIERHKIRDWTTNADVERRINGDLDMYLFDMKRQHELTLSAAEMDLIMENVLDVARKRTNL